MDSSEEDTGYSSYGRSEESEGAGGASDCSSDGDAAESGMVVVHRTPPDAGFGGEGGEREYGHRHDTRDLGEYRSGSDEYHPEYDRYSRVRTSQTRATEGSGRREFSGPSGRDEGRPRRDDVSPQWIVKRQTPRRAVARSRREPLLADTITGKTRVRDIGDLVAHAMGGLPMVQYGSYAVYPVGSTSARDDGPRSMTPRREARRHRSGAGQSSRSSGSSPKKHLLQLSVFLRAAVTNRESPGTGFLRWVYSRLGPEGAEQANNETEAFERSLLNALAQCVCPTHETYEVILMVIERARRGDTHTPGIPETGGDMFMAVVASVTAQFAEDPADLRLEVEQFPFTVLNNGVGSVVIIAKITTLKDVVQRLWAHLGNTDQHGAPAPPEADRLWFLDILMSTCLILRAHAHATLGAAGVGPIDLATIDAAIREVRLGTIPPPSHAMTRQRNTLGLTDASMVDRRAGARPASSSPTQDQNLRRGGGRSTREPIQGPVGQQDGGGGRGTTGEQYRYGTPTHSHGRLSAPGDRPAGRAASTPQTTRGGNQLLQTVGGRGGRAEAIRVGQRVNVPGSDREYQIVALEATRDGKGALGPHEDHTAHLCQVSREEGSPSSSQPFDPRDRSVTDDTYLHGHLRVPTGEVSRTPARRHGRGRQSEEEQRADEDRNLHALLNNDAMQPYHQIARDAMETTRAERAQYGLDGVNSRLWEPDTPVERGGTGGDSDGTDDYSQSLSQDSMDSRGNPSPRRDGAPRENARVLNQSFARKGALEELEATIEAKVQSAAGQYESHQALLDSIRRYIGDNVETMTSHLRQANHLLNAIEAATQDPGEGEGSDQDEPGFSPRGQPTARFARIITRAQDAERSGRRHATTEQEEGGAQEREDQKKRAEEGPRQEAVQALESIIYLSHTTHAKQHAFQQMRRTWGPQAGGGIGRWVGGAHRTVLDVVRQWSAVKTTEVGSFWVPAALATDNTGLMFRRWARLTRDARAWEEMRATLRLGPDESPLPRTHHEMSYAATRSRGGTHGGEAGMESDEAGEAGSYRHTGMGLEGATTVWQRYHSARIMRALTTHVSPFSRRATPLRRRTREEVLKARHQHRQEAPEALHAGVAANSGLDPTDPASAVPLTEMMRSMDTLREEMVLAEDGARTGEAREKAADNQTGAAAYDLRVAKEELATVRSQMATNAATISSLSAASALPPTHGGTWPPNRGAREEGQVTDHGIIRGGKPSNVRRAEFLQKLGHGVKVESNDILTVTFAPSEVQEGAADQTMSLGSTGRYGCGRDQWASGATTPRADHTLSLRSPGVHGGGVDQWASTATTSTSTAHDPWQAQAPADGADYDAHRRNVDNRNRGDRDSEIYAMSQRRGGLYAADAPQQMFSILYDVATEIEGWVRTAHGTAGSLTASTVARGRRFLEGASEGTCRRYAQSHASVGAGWAHGTGKRAPTRAHRHGDRRRESGHQSRVFAMTTRGVACSDGSAASRDAVARDNPTTNVNACYTCGANRTGTGESGAGTGANKWHDQAADCRYDPRRPGNPDALEDGTKMCFRCLKIFPRDDPHQGNTCEEAGGIAQCANFLYNPLCGCDGNGHSSFECPARIGRNGRARSPRSAQPRGGDGGGAGGREHGNGNQPGGGGAERRGRDGRGNDRQGDAKGKKGGSSAPRGRGREGTEGRHHTATASSPTSAATVAAAPRERGASMPARADKRLHTRPKKRRQGRTGDASSHVAVINVRRKRGASLPPRLSKRPPVPVKPTKRDRSHDADATETPPGGEVLGRSRNGVDNLQLEENRETQEMAAALKAEREKNAPQTNEQIREIEAQLKKAETAKTDKAEAANVDRPDKEPDGQLGPTGETKAGGPETETPTATTRVRKVGEKRRVRFQDDPSGPHPTRGVAIFKDRLGVNQVSGEGPYEHEVDRDTCRAGTRHMDQDQGVLDVFKADRNAGDYVLTRSVNTEERREHDERRRARKRRALLVQQVKGEGGRHQGRSAKARLNDLIQGKKGANMFYVDGEDEGDHACRRAMEEGMSHRERAGGTERNRQGGRGQLGTGETKGAQGKSARTLGRSQDLSRGLLSIKAMNDSQTTEAEVAMTDEDMDTTLCCRLPHQPSSVDLRNISVTGGPATESSSGARQATVHDGDGRLLTYNLSGGGEELTTLVQAGKIVLVVVDTAADRSHCDPTNPNLIETFDLDEVILAIMANGTTTRLEKGGILELWYLDAFGNSKRTMISVLITPGMGDMILLSATDVTTHLGQLRGPDGMDGRASICELLPKARARDQIDDHQVVRRFPLATAQGASGDGLDRPGTSGASYLAMALPRPERDQPRQRDIEALTDQYLCKFEGINDCPARIRSILARSMGTAEAEQTISELDQARSLPLEDATAVPEHAAALEGLECLRSYRLAQRYSTINQDGKETVIEIQDQEPGDRFASGDPVKVHNSVSVQPAHARGRVGLVAGYVFDIVRHQRVVFVDFGTSTSEKGAATCAGVEPQYVSSVHSPITPLRMEEGATVKIHNANRGRNKHGTVAQVVRSRVISTTRIKVTSTKGREMWVRQSECVVLRSAHANAHAVDPGSNGEKAESKAGGLEDHPPPNDTQGGWIIGDQVNLGGKKGTIEHLHTDGTRGRVATVSVAGVDPVMAQCAHLQRWAGPPARGDALGTTYRWPPEIGTVVTVTRSDNTRYYGAIVAADGQEDSPQPSGFTVTSVDYGDELVAPDTLCPATQVDESTAAALHAQLRQHDQEAGDAGGTVASRTAGVELSYGMEQATGQGGTILWPPPEAAHVLYDGHPSTIQARVEGDDKCPTYRITRVSDGRVTQDASVTRMTPGMPFEESHTNGQSRATSLRRKRKGKRDSVARTGMGRWVNTLGMLLSVWHLILGHCHADRVRKTLDVGTIGGRIIAASPTRAEGGDEIPPDGPCEGCQSTQTRTPWAKQSTAVRAEDCFDLLTIDYPGVKGGEHGGLPVSLTGGHIPLFIVDHHSSYCWVFQVTDYSGEEVCKVLEKMDTIARQCGRKIGALGSDSARTFTHGRVPRFCAQLGIRQTFTHTNSSNGNPRCERMIRTIYRAARACLTHSKLPLTCWYQALQYNAAVANVLCSKTSSITPHELMYHTVPVMNEHWHVFGSRGAVTHVSKWMMSTSKLLPTATPGYFIGQCQHRRGVEMLYMRRVKGGKVVPTIIETRDYVIFNLTTARPHCPADLTGLQGDPGEEAKALKSLSHSIIRQEPDPETGRTRDIDLPALPAAYLGEPRAAQAEDFIGRTVTNRDLDGQNEVNGVVKSTCYNQDLGATTLPGSPPARLVYQVTWEGGAGEHLTWNALHPLLSAGQLFDHRMTAGRGITCPNGHPVTRIPSKCDAYNCDGCGDAVRMGTDQARCSTCDWDICGTCIDGGPRDLHHAPAEATEEKEDHHGGPHAGEDDDQEAFQTGDVVNLLYQDEPSTQAKWYGARIERVVETGYHCRYDTGEAEFIRADDASQRLKYSASPTHPGPSLDRLNETTTDTTAVHAVRITGVPMRSSSARRRQGFLAHDLNPGMQDRTTHVRLFASPPRNGTPKGEAKEEGTKNSKGTTEEETRKQAWGDARKRAKEAQARVAEASTSFNLKNGDAVVQACEHRHQTGERTTVIAAQQDTPKGDDNEGGSVWESMTQPSIDSWLPWLKRNRPGYLHPGTSTTVYESGRPSRTGETETNAILIGLSNGKRSLSSTRAEEWRQGLADALGSKGEELRGTHVYIQLGTGMKVGGKAWMEKFLPAAASFALEAGRRFGTVTNIVQHVPAEPTRWYDPHNWAGHAGIWSNTRDALGMQEEVDSEEETKPGGYAQGERRGAPDIERTLREMETSNVDMLTSTSGLACPSRLDGMYPAITGLDSQVEGKEEFIGEGEDGRVGAPVKFATNQGEHHDYRLRGKYNVTAPMLGNCTAGVTHGNFDGGIGARERRRQADVRTNRKRRELRAAERANRREQRRHEKRGSMESGPLQMTDRIKESRVRAAALSEKKSVEMILISANDEEPTYRDALSGPAGAIWYDAVLAELITQFNQSAFRVVPRAAVDKGINVMLSGIRLNVKWTHTTALGLSPKRFKARFVCGGDSQEYLQTYVYVSSPCPRPATVRWLLAKSSDPGWEAYGVDVAGAFCQAPVELPGEMFMEFPRWLAPDDRGAETPDGVPWNQRQDTFNGKGEYQDWENYARHMDPIAGARASSSNAQRRKGDRSDFVLELKRMIYGCKQSARVWHQLWCAFLEDRGFKRSAGDECLWSRMGENGDALIVCTHVDDTLCVTPSEKEYLRFLEEMRDVFECTDEGGGKSIEFFLGIRIERDEEHGAVTLSQEGLHDKILHTADTSNLGSVASTPMLESAHMQPGTEREEINAEREKGGLDLGWQYGDELPDRSREEDNAIAQVPYRRLVGQLIHCVTWTRPDLAYAVSSLARFADPLRTRWAHVRAMARLVEYIRNTKTMGITYRGLKEGEEANIIGFVDADWAGDDADRLSMTSYVAMCRGGAISWQSAKQEIVAQSSFESELIATRAVAAEMIGLIKDFPTIERGKAPTPLVIGCDNAAVCAVSTGGGSYKNRRHIDIRYLLIRETVMKGAVILEPVPTDWNPADLGTKSLGEEKFCRFRDYMMNNADRKYEEGAEWMSTKVRPGGVPSRASRIGSAGGGSSAPSRATPHVPPGTGAAW